MINAPQRNLGAGDPWGRWVENIIDKTSKAVVQLEQSVQRAFGDVTASVQQLQRQIDKIRRRSEISTTHDESSGFGLSSGNNTIITTDIPIQPGKTTASIFVYLSGFVVAESTSRPTLNVSVGGQQQPGVVSTVVGFRYSLFGRNSVTFDNPSGESIPVTVVLTTPGLSYTFPGNNRVSVDVISAFSD